MIRDELMQRVVNRSQEPITPFIERVQWLAQEKEISTILVAGSSGSYFHVADTIIQMDHYQPVDITDFAKKEAQAFPAIQPSSPKKAFSDYHRIVQPDSSFREERRIKMKTMGVDGISVNHETIELRYLEQLADPEQVNALSALLRYTQLHIFNGRETLQESMTKLEKLLNTQGLDFLAEGNRIPPNLAMPRIQEIYGCFNRYRSLRLLP